MEKRVLVLEDNPDLAYGLKNNLEQEGYEVVVVHDGETAINLIRSEHFDGAVVDLMVPKRNGFEFIAAARERESGPRILVLTARDSRERERALALGAHDFLMKPFPLLELLARVEAILREKPVVLTPAQVREAASRYGTKMDDDPFRDAMPFGDCVYYPHPDMVLRDGQLVKMRKRESYLLAVFLEYHGQLLSRDFLLRKVCGHRQKVESRAIDQYVSSLREIIGDDPNDPRHVRTIRGEGYIFVLDLKPLTNAR